MQIRDAAGMSWEFTSRVDSEISRGLVSSSAEWRRDVSVHAGSGECPLKYAISDAMDR